MQPQLKSSIQQLVGPILADTGAKKWIFQLKDSLFYPAVQLLGVSVSSSLAPGVPLVRCMCGRGWWGAGGRVQECKVLANLSEANAPMRVHAVSHIKDDRISLLSFSGSTPGFIVQAGGGDDAEQR